MVKRLQDRLGHRMECRLDAFSLERLLGKCGIHTNGFLIKKEKKQPNKISTILLLVLALGIQLFVYQATCMSLEVSLIGFSWLISRSVRTELQPEIGIPYVFSWGHGLNSVGFNLHMGIGLFRKSLRKFIMTKIFHELDKILFIWKK